MTIYDKGKNRGFLSIFALVFFAVFALPYLVLGAGRGSGSSGGFHISAGGFHVSRVYKTPSWLGTCATRIGRAQIFEVVTNGLDLAR